MAADEIDDHLAFQNGAETRSQFKAFFEIQVEGI
jgi:hypothetical protein